MREYVAKIYVCFVKKNVLANIIYIIIWLSPYVLSVRSLSPPKPAGLASPNFRRYAPNWMWNRDSQKNLKKKFDGNLNFFDFLKKKNFWSNFFLKNVL
jgi:hypothetical protein